MAGLRMRCGGRAMWLFFAMLSKKVIFFGLINLN
jgi:hypothetical protein